MSGPGGRLADAWADLREHPARSALQALGVVLGVASVLGGLAILDSQRRQSERLYVKQGGLDKLNVHPAPMAQEGAVPALQAANLGLRGADADRGAALAPEAVAGVSVSRVTRLPVASPAAAQDREVTGIGADYLAQEGYAVAGGRPFSALELETGAPVAILGSAAALAFFPDGEPVGRTLRVGGVPVTVVGTFGEQVFRFRADGENLMRWRNRIIALPVAMVQRRFFADPHGRLDKVAFQLPRQDSIPVFARGLTSLLVANHRNQRDFRLDDLAARVKRMEDRGRVYDLVFLLSGALALLGGGMVNVNIQLASLKERVREVGLKMALGASGGQIFRSFLVEAMLLNALGAAVGLGAGALFSRAITTHLGIPLAMRPESCLAAFLLALLCGFGFALYPAWKASRLSPMEALRHE